uniref:Remorin C-terminal domain-containing protein n=2 Tax=Opuntia streptacantha TaxID=393608 RepID=A0A7C9EDP4_OPUST
MEYERIDKPQNGIISPSKLRVKLMGISPKKRKEGSNCNSSRTSPARLEDSEFVKNSLLACSNEDFDASASSAGPPPTKLYTQTVSTSVSKQSHCLQKENIDTSHVKMQQASRGDSGNSSAVHPLKSNEDENLDYDSNASSSSFEFHRGERMAHRSLTRSLSRPTSYKWNDAEKWIMNKQAVQASYSNKNHGVPGMNVVRVAPEAAGYEYRPPIRVPDTKKVDFCQSTAQMDSERFNSAHPGPELALARSNAGNVQIDLYPQNKDLSQGGNAKNFPDDVAGTPAIRAISMRDMGTEMTPVPSQEPSRTATPIGATTPLRSPTSSIPSSPRRGELEGTQVDCTTDGGLRNLTQKGDKELSEQELKMKTRREIVALGVQLGKMSIAAWASKDEEKSPSPRVITDPEEPERIEFEKRAAAWEEAEKSKHAARYKREEIKIQAWESQQKAKLEEELRRIEAKVERLRTKSQAKMVKKITLARKRSEEKRAAAEARKKRQAEKTAAQAEYIRQTGRIPPSEFVCCGLFS